MNVSKVKNSIKSKNSKVYEQSSEPHEVSILGNLAAMPGSHSLENNSIGKEGSFIVHHTSYVRGDWVFFT